MTQPAYSVARAVAPAVAEHLRLHRQALAPHDPGLPPLELLPDAQAIEALVDTAFWACVGSPLFVTSPLSTSELSRSASTLLEIASSDCRNSRKWRLPANIRSRMTSNVQRSPKSSSPVLMGHVDRRSCLMGSILYWLQLASSRTRIPILKCNQFEEPR